MAAKHRQQGPVHRLFHSGGARGRARTGWSGARLALAFLCSIAFGFGLAAGPDWFDPQSPLRHALTSAIGTGDIPPSKNTAPEPSARAVETAPPLVLGLPSPPRAASPTMAVPPSPIVSDRSAPPPAETPATSLEAPQVVLPTNVPSSNPARPPHEQKASRPAERDVTLSPPAAAPAVSAAAVATPAARPSTSLASPSVGSDDPPTWRRNAVAAPARDGRPMIAVVIDDMGLDQRRSAAVIDLQGPLTLGFLPYARDLARQTGAARQNGHELIVHVSMQPERAAEDPGPNSLSVDLSPDEIRRRLAWALAAFDGYVGINNHMGSRFTGDRTGMAVVMAELRQRGLLFLDSRTGQASVGASSAAAQGVPYAARHVFLDNKATAEEVGKRLAEAEHIARRGGMAVAIGHPHDATAAMLKLWLPTLAARGFVLAPLSAVVSELEARREATRQSAAGHGEARSAPVR